MTGNQSPAGAPPLTRLGEEEAKWREHVREVAHREVAPRVAAMDRDARLDADLLAALFAERLMAVQIPAAYGGAGRNLFDVVITIEELARVDPAVAVTVDVQNALVISALLRHGTADQRRRYLPRLATGMVGAYAISEPHAGSDAFALSATLRRSGTGFVLNGRKRWTTNAAEAGLFLVFARLIEPAADDDPGTGTTAADNGGPAGITAVLVQRQATGVQIGPRVGKLGIRANSTCDVVLEDVEVAAQDVLGRAGAGAELIVRTLDIGKIGIAAQLVGLAQGALDAAVDYAQRRTQFGNPIVSYQGVQFPLAARAAELRAARTLLYDTTRLVEHDAPAGEVTEAAAAAKYFASEMAERTAALAVEVFGGNGFSTEYPIEKFYRDVKVGKIYEGTSNMQFRTIAAAMSRPATRRPKPEPPGQEPLGQEPPVMER
jgi:short/branched chain acyl-CoA dehydrogenase